MCTISIMHSSVFSGKRSHLKCSVCPTIRGRVQMISMPLSLMSCTTHGKLSVPAVNAPLRVTAALSSARNSVFSIGFQDVMPLIFEFWSASRRVSLCDSHVRNPGTVKIVHDLRNPGGIPASQNWFATPETHQGAMVWWRVGKTSMQTIVKEQTRRRTPGPVGIECKYNHRACDLSED